jgi:hypothetical protein
MGENDGEERRTRKDDTKVVHIEPALTSPKQSNLAHIMEAFLGILELME